MSKENEEMKKELLNSQKLIKELQNASIENNNYCTQLETSTEENRKLVRINSTLSATNSELALQVTLLSLDHTHLLASCHT